MTYVFSILFVLIGVGVLVMALLFISNGVAVEASLEGTHEGNSAKATGIGILLLVSLLLLLGGYVIWPEGDEVVAAQAPVATTTPSAIATVRPSPTPPPAVPPYIVESRDGLRIVVEAVRQEATSGRPEMTVRMENRTDFSFGLTANNVLAVDERERSYGIDPAASTFPLEEAANKYALKPGLTRRGTIVLDSRLPPDVNRLDLSFSFQYSNRDSAYSVLRLGTRVD